MKQQFWTGTGAFFAMLVLIMDSRTALEGAREGMELCIRTVIPSLLPFFVLSILLTSSMMGSGFSLLKPLGILFHIPQGAESLLIPAFLGGYPVGARTIAQAYQDGHCRKEDAERLLAFCSNAGPAFLFGIGSGLFSRKWMLWLLWGIHIFSAWMVSQIFADKGMHITVAHNHIISPSDVLSSALHTMGQVCGWVILFRMIITFLKRWLLWAVSAEVQVFLVGMLELTNGCQELYSIESEPLRFLFFSCFLAFGGLCVSMQTISVAKGLSYKYYVAGKLLQTIFSLLLSAAVAYQLWYLVPGIVLFFCIIPRKTEKRYSIPRKAVV